MSGRRAPSRSPADRTRQISDFYAAHAHRLRALVASKTGAPTEAVADACQSAWLTLLRRPDINLDARGLGWLTVVAVHEVHHQWRDRTRNLPMGALSLGTGDPGELGEPAATGDRRRRRRGACRRASRARRARRRPGRAQAGGAHGAVPAGARLPLPRDRLRYRRQLHGREPSPDRRPSSTASDRARARPSRPNERRTAPRSAALWPSTRLRPR